MAPHYVLYEHAAGYALFRLQEFEEIATFLPQVEESVNDVSKFSQVQSMTDILGKGDLTLLAQVVNLIGFFPFKTAGDALANINSVSEGIVHDDLKLFLDTNLPKVNSLSYSECSAVVQFRSPSCPVTGRCNLKLQY